MPARTGERDRDEPADSGLGRQAAGCCECVEAVARQFVRRDIVPKVTAFCALGEQVSDHVAELLLCPGDLLVSMQECGELGVVVRVGFVRDERVCLEHGFESLGGAPSLVSDFREIFEMAGDLTFVPGKQDCFDAWEVLVERRASDARLRGDLGHRYGSQPVLGHQRCGGIQDRLTHLTAVGVDRVAPQLGHDVSIRHGYTQDTLAAVATQCLVKFDAAITFEVTLEQRRTDG